jgi:predicted permease
MESVVISAIAGSVALALASVVPRLGVLAGLRIQNLSPDGMVFGFALSLATIACLASGLMPALRSTRHNLAGRANERHAGHGPAPLRNTLLATQIALSMVLLIGAGLLTRTIYHVVSSGPGFDAQGIEAFTVQLPRGLGADGRSNFTHAFRIALSDAGIPAASSEFSPLAGPARMASVRKEGQVRDMAHTVLLRGVSSNYFQVLGLPLLSGRPMADDGSDEAVVSELAARRLWPGENPIGKRLLSSKPPGAAISESGDDADRFHDVVGVARDVPFGSLTRIEPAVYVSTASHNVFFIRHPSPAVAGRVAAIAGALEPGVRLVARPLADEVRQSVTALAVGSGFAWALGLLALALATVGAFGVFAYMVEERRREIGVRMALGARPRQVIRSVMTATRAPLLFGLGVGLVLSLGAAQLLRSFLYGLSPTDPVTYLGVAAILAVAALIATWIPARRATRIDPAITLRSE